MYFLFLGGTVQIRPSVVTSQASGSNPGHVQNVQIVQGPQGQLQVRGLLQGLYQQSKIRDKQQFQARNVGHT